MRCTGTEISIFVDDHLICYNDAGMDDMPVIICVHDFGLNRNMWNIQLDELKAAYRVIAYDVRGHGASDSGSEIFSLELFGRDLLYFMDALEIQQAVICGFSMGGLIALHAYHLEPSRFNGLILINTQCKADTPKDARKRTELLFLIQNKGLDDFTNTYIQSLFTPDSFQAKSAEVAAVKEMLLSSQKDSLDKTLQAIIGRNKVASILREIEVPVLILTGADNHIIPADTAQFIKTNVMDTFDYMIDYSAHMCNLENPGAFGHHVNKFCYQFARKQIHYSKQQYFPNSEGNF